jgi:hypothetical protein
MQYGLMNPVDSVYQLTSNEFEYDNGTSTIKLKSPAHSPKLKKPTSPELERKTKEWTSLELEQKQTKRHRHN